MSTIKLFETKQVRSLWDQDKETWFFSIVDDVAVLTDSPKPRTYWSVLKNRLKKESSELATNGRTPCEHGQTLRVLEAVGAVTHDQKQVLVNKVFAKYGRNLNCKTFALWGLALKPTPTTCATRPAASSSRHCCDPVPASTRTTRWPKKKPGACWRQTCNLPTGPCKQCRALTP